MWKDIFAFNQVERRGAWALCILMCMSLLINALFPFWFRPGKDFLSSHEDELLALADSVFFVNAASNDSSHTATAPGLPRYQFDPNNIDPDLHHEYGLSKAQALTLYRYVSAGGKFRKLGDLARMRNLTAEDLERIEDFLIFPDASKPIRTESHKKQNVRIPDLNSADTAQLMALPGIGKVLAYRIIKYRDALGGFVTTEQLREVYGLSAETVDRISASIDLDTSKRVLLDLRSDSFQVLLRHPYLDLEMVKKIFQTRKTSPALLNPASIDELLGIPPDKQGKIAPYIQK